MNDNPRARRLAEQIKVIVAQLLEKKIKDPRLGFVTVTDVRVTGDLQQASVFYTVLGGEEDRARTAAALESAKGFIRSEVGKQTGIRLTPTVEFHLDSVPETAEHINDALAQAQRRDNELAVLRAGKTYAGERDPYKKPRDEDEEPTSTGSTRAVAGAGVGSSAVVTGGPGQTDVADVAETGKPHPLEVDEYLPLHNTTLADDLERVEDARDVGAEHRVYLDDERPVEPDDFDE